MNRIFSERLKILRAGESQGKTAKMLGISQVSLSQYERGTREPGFAVLERIAKKFRVSLDWMFGLSARRELDYSPPPMKTPEEEKKDADVFALLDKVDELERMVNRLAALVPTDARAPVDASSESSREKVDA